jgi:hypothetical protein
MVCNTESRLAIELGVTRAAIYGWRKEYADAPLGKDTVEWESFIERHGLRQHSTRNFRRDLHKEAETNIAMAELELGRAGGRVRELAPKFYEVYEDERRKLLPHFERLYEIIDEALAEVSHLPK